MMLRPTLAILLLTSPMLGAAPQTEAPVRLRQDPPVLSPADAKALSPEALGDALLAPDHRPVTEVTIGPQGMEPPPPPDGSGTTRVRLYLQPGSSQQRGFCERTIATTYLASVAGTNAAPRGDHRPGGLTTETAYRWIGETRGAQACNAPRSSFFVPTAGQTQRALEAVRLLASASAAAKRGARLGFPVSVVDREGPEFLAYEREHPEQPPTPGLRVITDATKALASLPLEAVSWAGPSARAVSNVLGAGDLAATAGRMPEGAIVFLGGDWTAGIVILDGRIVRLRLQRAIPPPF